MKNTRPQNFVLYLPILALVAYVIWWVGINYFDLPSPDNFTDSYSLVALTGGISGIVVAKKWGLFKSKFGRALSFFAVGLFLQFIGQVIYALYFRLGHVELAFPNIGDLAYIMTSVFYIFAVYSLLKVIVYKGSIFKPRIILLISVLATVGLVLALHFSFVNIAIHDDRGAIYAFLNAAYPSVQALYFLLGLIAIMQARRIAGGKMLGAVSILLFALIVQYGADFNFLYQSYHDTWQAAGVNDLLYVLGYGFMALSILMIDRVRRQVLATPVVESAGAKAE
jgi:hypothetical protein